jgi:hypothetical protein
MTPTKLNLVRRRALPVAAALAAAGLTGCMSFHHSPEAARPLTGEQAAQSVNDFAANTDSDDDQADTEQMRPDRPYRRMPAISENANSPNLSAPTTRPAIAADAPSAMTAVSVPIPVTPPPAPALAAPVRPVEPTVEQAMAVLRRQAAAHPALTTTLALALLDNAQGHVPNPAAAERLSAPDQKLLSDLLNALDGMTPVSTSTTLADRASSLVDAAKKWQTDADLSLPRVALATRVDSFGNYTPVDAKFPQGIERTVILYCEVANFTSRRADDGWYETKLSQQDTLLTADGLLLWRPTAEDVDDRSMNQRHDFYLVKKITLPSTLAAGKYTLRLSVTDRAANKHITATLPLEITPN